MYKKVISAVLAALMLLCLLSSCQGGDTTADSAIDQARSAVVRILVQSQDNRYQAATAFGVQKSETETEPSVFVSGASPISKPDGAAGTVYILRDDCEIHVSQDGTIAGEELDHSNLIPCTVLHYASDGTPDLALFQPEESVPDLTGLPLTYAEKALQEASPTYAERNADESSPVLVLDCQGGSSDCSVTEGKTYRLTTYTIADDTQILLYTAPNGPGNGGPVLSQDGSVVGITNSTLETGASNRYGAIASEYLIRLLGGLKIPCYVPAPKNQHRIPALYLYIAAAAAAGILLLIILIVLIRKAARRRKNKKQADQGRTEKSGGTPTGSAVDSAPPTVPIQKAPKQESPAPVSPAKANAPAQPRPDTTPASSPAPQKAAPYFAPSESRQAPAPSAPTQYGAAVPPQSSGKSSIGPGFRIQGTLGQYANRRFALSGTLRIGKDPKRNDLIYPADARAISAVHCVLTVADKRLLIEDLASTFGTYVNGSRLAPNKPVELHRGDKIWLGYEDEAYVIDWRD